MKDGADPAAIILTPIQVYTIVFGMIGSAGRVTLLALRLTVLLTRKITTIEHTMVETSPNRKGILRQIDIAKLVELDFPQISNFLCSLISHFNNFKNYGIIIRLDFYVTAIFTAADNQTKCVFVIHLIILGRTQF